MMQSDLGRHPLKICLIAGEASGDLLGGRLMQSLRAQASAPVIFCGVGGNTMMDQGFSSLFPMTDLSVMGLVEIIPHIPRLLRRLSETAAMIAAEKPHVVVTIDAPGFCFPLAKRLKKLGIPLIHYTAPTVWAWRPKRAKKIAKLYNHLLCLFPFEPPYFLPWGLPATYVGHSLLDQLGAGEKPVDILKSSPPQLCLLPGSRIGEVRRLLPVFLQTARRLKENYPDLICVLPTLPHLVSVVSGIIDRESPDICVAIIDDRQKGVDAMQKSTAALAASGTVSLELGLWRIPMVVAYRVSFLTEIILRFLVRAPYVSLVNILENKNIVPEFLQKKCAPNMLAAALSPLLCSTPARTHQLNGFEIMYQRLTQTLTRSRRPSDQAAEIVLSYVGTHSN